MANKAIPGVWDGLSVEILIVRSGSSPTIGLHSPDQRIDGWGDLEGNVGSRRGWWVAASELESCIREAAHEYEVNKDFEHRGVQLKGKKCKQLASMQDGTIFVEFEEDVNGCSADGLGRAGHCVALDHKILKVCKQKKKEKHSK